jgi:hypothetical protein
VKKHYPAIERFAMLCRFLAWVNVVVGLIGFGLSLFALNTYHAPTDWPVFGVALSLSVFLSNFALQALADLVCLIQDAALAMLAD